MAKKIKTLHFIQLLINFAIIGFVVAALVLSITKNKEGIAMFKYYYVISALVCAVAALLLIVPNIKAIKTGKENTPRVLDTLAFVGAVMSAVTILMTLVLFFLDREDYKGSFAIQDGELFLTTIIPALSIINILFFEITTTIRFRRVFVPLIVFFGYAACIFATMTVLHFTKGAAEAAKFAPYDFFQVIPEWADKTKKANQWVSNIVALCAIFLIQIGLSILIFCINRIVNHIVIGVRYEEDNTIPAADVPTSSDSIPQENIGLTLKRYDLNSKSLNDDINNNPGHIYHISYHDRRLKTWKVKAEEAERALKVFATQKEAIEYAKGLIAKNGGSIRIHSMVGKMRKDFYTTAPTTETSNVSKTETKVETPKAETKKVETPKVEAKKEVAKKPVAKKAPAKKVAPKKAPAKKPAKKTGKKK